MAGAVAVTDADALSAVITTQRVTVIAGVVATTDAEALVAVIIAIGPSVSVAGETATADADAPPGTITATILYVLTGTTRDGVGAVLGACTVQLFRTSDDVYMGDTVSSGAGAFSLTTTEVGPFYIVAYLVGAPDRAGTTVNTLVAV